MSVSEMRKNSQKEARKINGRICRIVQRINKVINLMRNTKNILYTLIYIYTHTRVKKKIF